LRLSKSDGNAELDLEVKHFGDSISFSGDISNILGKLIEILTREYLFVLAIEANFRARTGRLEKLCRGVGEEKCREVGKLVEQVDSYDLHYSRFEDELS
jgi:hypothetical protein